MNKLTKELNKLGYEYFIFNNEYGETLQTNGYMIRLYDNEWHVSSLELSTYKNYKRFKPMLKYITHELLLTNLQRR